MQRIVIYGEHPDETKYFQPELKKLILSRQEWPLIEDYTGDLPGFLERVRCNPFLIMLAVVNGPKAPEIIQRIKENNPEARLIWYSDHDYALYSFGMRVTSFGLLPVTPGALCLSMDACGLYHQNAEAPAPDIV